MDHERLKNLILELFGPLSPEDAPTLWGRKSEIREAASDLIRGQHLPAPPRLDEDGSLRYDAEDRVRRQRRKNRGPLASTNRDETSAA